MAHRNMTQKRTLSFIGKALIAIKNRAVSAPEGCVLAVGAGGGLELWDMSLAHRDWCGPEPAHARPGGAAAAERWLRRPGGAAPRSAHRPGRLMALCVY